MCNREYHEIENDQLREVIKHLVENENCPKIYIAADSDCPAWTEDIDCSECWRDYLVGPYY